MSLFMNLYESCNNIICVESVSDEQYFSNTAISIEIIHPEGVNYKGSTSLK